MIALSQNPSTTQFFTVKIFVVIESLACKSLATAISSIFEMVHFLLVLFAITSALCFSLLYSALPATSSQVDKFFLMKSLPSVDVAMNLVVLNNNFTQLPLNIYTLAALYKTIRALVNGALQRRRRKKQVNYKKK